MADEPFNVVVNSVERLTRFEEVYYIKSESPSGPLALAEFFDPVEKGKYLKHEFCKYKTYTVPGIVNEDGSLREMSIGGLVMALCLQRAAEAEKIVIDLMEQTAVNTAKIRFLAQLHEKLATKADGINKVACLFRGTWPSEGVECHGLDYTDAEYDEAKEYLEQGGCSWITNAWDFVLKANFGIEIDISSQYVYEPKHVEQFVAAVNSKLDSLNSISQELLIELQNQTTKRDQAYDLLAAMLKSFNTTMMANVNNI